MKVTMKKMNKKIWAIIGARAGSKGVKNKNIRDLCGFPLIAYSLLSAHLSKYIIHTIVSSDSLDILQLSERYNHNISTILRPSELASDIATDFEWITHAISQFSELPDLLVHLRPTTPLRHTITVDAAISMIYQISDSTSLRSAHKLDESPYKMFIKDDMYFKPFMQMEKKEFYNLPRQSFPQVYHPNGYVDILRTEHILKYNNLHGDRILAFETPKAIEVDTEENFKELELITKNSTIWKQLNELQNITISTN
jgi:CMP-N,N'-diacetyllegionaminic acid synthase